MIQYNVVGKLEGIENQPGSKPKFYHLPAECPWSNYLISLCPSFLFNKIELKLGITSWGCCGE